MKALQALSAIARAATRKTKAIIATTETKRRLSPEEARRLLFKLGGQDVWSTGWVLWHALKLATKEGVDYDYKENKYICKFRIDRFEMHIIFLEKEGVAVTTFAVSCEEEAIVLINGDDVTREFLKSSSHQYNQQVGEFSQKLGGWAREIDPI